MAAGSAVVLVLLLIALTVIILGIWVCICKSVPAERAERACADEEEALPRYEDLPPPYRH